MEQKRPYLRRHRMCFVLFIVFLQVKNYGQKSHNDFFLKVAQDSIRDRTYIQKDIRNIKCFLTSRNLFMYNESKFNELSIDSIQIIKIGNHTLYKNKFTNKELSVWVNKEQKKYLFKIQNRGKVFKYSLRLKKNYNLKITKIDYPIKNYNFITLYFKYTKQVNNDLVQDYISMRFDIEKEKQIVMFTGYF